MKKLIPLLCLLLMLCACGKAASPSLYDQGLALVQSMDQMAESEAYIRLFSADEEMLHLLQQEIIRPTLTALLHSTVRPALTLRKYLTTEIFPFN